MKNPFENISTKEWIYLAGAFASLAGLAWVFGRGSLTLPTGTQTDVRQNANSATPIYTNYNMGPIVPVPLGTPAGDEVTNSGGCCCNTGCAGPSALDDPMQQYAGVDKLLAFYQSTNPEYRKLWQAQMDVYSRSFASGQYASGPIA